jgi:translation initiation factor 1 (eIF-1/SUI1)
LEAEARKAFGLTTISDIPLDEAGLQELASTLKQTCGTGGTVKDDDIELEWQLDLRRSAADLLLVERARDWLLGE